MKHHLPTIFARHVAIRRHHVPQTHNQNQAQNLRHPQTLSRRSGPAHHAGHHHQTKEAFNHYVGIDELQLLKEFMRKSARRQKA
jgi:hypothetical protein